MCGCIGPGMVWQPLLYPMQAAHAKYERTLHRWPGVMNLLKWAGIRIFTFVNFGQFFVFFSILGGPYLLAKLHRDIETRGNVFGNH
jgi:hypothetical protein